MHLFSLLTASGTHFVIVGGLATVMHGVDRTTADVDLIIDLTPESARAAIDALTRAGYRSMAPVNPITFADAATRATWKRDHGMQVFSLWDSANRSPTVDLFLESPIPFADLWRDAVDMTFRGITIKVASLAHLIRLKELAGRPQDLADVERLRQIENTRRQP
jgi:hypothetical protein